MTSKIIDAVIPVYKPGKEVSAMISMLIRQSCPIRRIFIMQTVEEDEALLDFGDLEQVSVIPVPVKEFDHGATRDQGVRLSEADYVLILTQDAVIRSERLVEFMVQPFEDPGVCVVFGRQKAKETASEIEKYTRVFNYPRESSVKEKADIPRLGIKTFFGSDVLAMYERERYLEIGGFESPAIFSEEMLFTWKAIMAGYKAAYAGRAYVVHSHDYSGFQQFSRNFDVGVFQRDHEEIFKTISSVKEGSALVKATAIHLLKIGKPWLIISLVYLSGMKFLGYRFGKAYRHLPMWLVKKLTMNKKYWDHL